MDVRLGLKILLLGSVAMFSIGTEVLAKPGFANETGLECAGCHKGKMAEKKFTDIGKDYCIYLKDRGRLKSSNSCTNKTLNLFDSHGNPLGKHTICVADPAPC